MQDRTEFDYIVVGSGAGGGTVASRLAEAGMSVALIEAGGDPRTDGGSARFPGDYDIPAFHAFASENPAMAWNFFVEHFADQDQAKRDSKRVTEGVLYPRAGTLGGCTSHNAMIFVTAQRCDWDSLAKAVEDDGWSWKEMCKYQQKVENCRHRPLWRLLSKLGLMSTGHGWNGWLNVEIGTPIEAVADSRLRHSLELAGIAATKGIGSIRAAIERLIIGKLDPNDVRQNGREGLCYAPLATNRHCRVGARDRVLDVIKRYPDSLHLKLNTLVTKILLKPDGTAYGVECQQAAHLYRADPNPSPADGPRIQFHARREVILCGGAFNTPQLLKLSGIGPADELTSHDIPVVVDLPGVGTNLQDRYEVCVQYSLKKPWAALTDARYEADDPIGTLWSEKRSGAYISNGAALAFKRKSDPKLGDADLFIFGLLGCFKGYYPKYSEDLINSPNVLSWAILKARTENRAGTVKLRSGDPRDTPIVNFHYFEEGSDKAQKDLKAVAAGVRFVRDACRPLQAKGLIDGEMAPGADITDSGVEGFVRDNAWGHHASCTCPMGDRGAGGVLTSRLEVHGTRRLRVVDASIFPRIPGYFIVSAVYMAAEKAADMILKDARMSAALERA